MQPTSTATNRTMPRIVAKIVVSTTLAGLAYLVTLPINDSTKAQVLWGIGASLFVGGLAFVVQFLLDVDRTMAGFGRRIEDGLANATEGAALSRLLKASPLGVETKDFILHATQMPSYSSQIVLDFARSQIQTAATRVNDLFKDGKLEYQGEDRDWLLNLTAMARHSIDATSLTSIDADGNTNTDFGLWTTDLGRRYLDLQADKIRDGIVVRRLFIVVRHDMEYTDDLRRTLLLHTAKGVVARVLGRDRIPPGTGSDVGDYVIFDGGLVYESTPAAHNEPTKVNTMISALQITIDGRSNSFARLWRQAKDFEA